MKRRELANLGFSEREVSDAAIAACTRAKEFKLSKRELRKTLQRLKQNPAEYLEIAPFEELAALLNGRAETAAENYSFDHPIDYQCYGEEIEDGAHEQMRNACKLPVAAKAALMPDAHVGYGLPIGGVLATEGAVIPYAVGVDIACRVKLSVLDIPPEQLKRKPAQFELALEHCTRFGMGAHFTKPHDHAVMEERWDQSPLVNELKSQAWRQLGTSGSGNHFVEFGEFELFEPCKNLMPGQYLAILSHSGSRGAGARIAGYYSKLAEELHRGLPRELKHLAWLNMNAEGAEYWAAMELMGRYASANHELIHDNLRMALGAHCLFDVENHHNFAWKEVYDGKEYIVHRKGATPAGKGVLGIIPGTMSDPGYLVEGLGNPDSLNSSSHGAGRRMSRTEAKKTTTVHALQKHLRDRGVRLLSAGLDESPHAYKAIDEIMRAQKTLVRSIGKFSPRIVKMAPAGERPED